MRPENTIPAFEYALAQGVDVLELDMAVTKDNVVVVSHDETMNPALLDEARRLSVDERIELVAAIWDTVAEDANAAAFPVSDSHRLELNHRLEDRQRNPEAESPWSEVADRLSKR